MQRVPGDRADALDLEVLHPDYISIRIEITPGMRNYDGRFNVRVFLSPRAYDTTNTNGGGCMHRAVLSWGAEPADLDTWLESSSDCPKVYYSSRRCVYSTGLSSGSGYALLDIDVTSGYGPETLSMVSLPSGRYRYTVHRYSGSGNFVSGGAVVRLYFGQQSLICRASEASNVSSGNQDLWHVFDLVVSGAGDERQVELETPSDSPAFFRGGCEASQMQPMTCNASALQYNFTQFNQTANTASEPGGWSTSMDGSGFSQSSHPDSQCQASNCTACRQIVSMTCFCMV